VKSSGYASAGAFNTQDSILLSASGPHASLLFTMQDLTPAHHRGLFCFCAVSEIGCGQKELAKKLGMTQPGVGYAVIRGEAISESNHFELKKMP
jgi:DNA-binding MarR family transcriptional regulator